MLYPLKPNKNQKYFSNFKKGGNHFEVLIETFTGMLNRTYDEFRIHYGDTYIYDRFQSPTNNVGDMEFSGRPGRGLNFTTKSTGYWDHIAAYGASGGDGPGQLAVKFQSSDKDTLFGYRAYFDGISAAPDAIRFDTFKSGTDGLPGDTIEKTGFYTLKGWDDFIEDFEWREYTTQLLKEPVPLEKGEYWIAVSQLGQDGYELGGSKYRMGMRTVVWSDSGDNSNFMFIHLELRELDEDGKLVNRQIFAYRNSLDDSLQWVSFSPVVGNTGYAHLDHEGTVKDSTKTFSRGTWIPMLMPYLSSDHLVGVEDTNSEIEARLIQNYPNPADQMTTISFALNKPVNVDLNIYDLHGNCIKQVYKKFLGAGSYTIPISVSDLSSGIYFYKMIAGDNMYSKSLFILR